MKNIDVKNCLGKRIQELRKSQKMTQEELSEKVQISVLSLSRIETGKNYPSPDNLAKLAAALNVSIEQLFTFSDIKEAEGLTDEINFMLQAIGKDKEKLLMVYKFLKSIL